MKKLLLIIVIGIIIYSCNAPTIRKEKDNIKIPVLIQKLVNYKQKDIRNDSTLVSTLYKFEDDEFIYLYDINPDETSIDCRISKEGIEGTTFIIGLFFGIIIGVILYTILSRPLC